MKESLGERIKRKRKEAKITQSELARMINNTSPAISDWETGKGEPRLKTLIGIAEALNTTTDYLLIGKETYTKGENMESIERLKQVLESPYTKMNEKAELLGYIQIFYEKDQRAREENKNIHPITEKKKKNEL